MLRQLLFVLVLVFGVVLFTGCEQDGVNGTENGVTAPDETPVEQDGTTMPDESERTTDEFGLERGQRDTTDDTKLDDTTTQQPTEGPVTEPNAL